MARYGVCGTVRYTFNLQTEADSPAKAEEWMRSLILDEEPGWSLGCDIIIDDCEEDETDYDDD